MTVVVVAFALVALVDNDVVTLDLRYRCTELDYYKNCQRDCTDVAVRLYWVSRRHIQRNYHKTIHHFGQNVGMKSSCYVNLNVNNFFFFSFLSSYVW